MSKQNQSKTNGPQGVYKYLDCSTTHITEETMRLLDRGEESGLQLTVAPYKYGAFVTVPDDIDDAERVRAMPKDLLEVLTFAHRRGCYVVRFDSDGDDYDELPRFEW